MTKKKDVIFFVVIQIRLILLIFSIVDILFFLFVYIEEAYLN